MVCAVYPVILEMSFDTNASGTAFHLKYRYLLRSMYEICVAGTMVLRFALGLLKIPTGVETSWGLLSRLAKYLTISIVRI